MSYCDFKKKNGMLISKQELLWKLEITNLNHNNNNNNNKKNT